MADTPSLWVPGLTSLDAPFDIVPDIARFEPPDILAFRLAREMAAGEAERILAFVRQAAPKTGGLFSMTDASVPLPRVSINAAIAFNRQFNPRLLRAAAVVGASYSMRVLSETLVRAARLLKLEVAQSPVRYFDDADAARAWFAALRTSPA